MSECKTSKRKMEAAERQRQAMTLRRAGASFVEIARQVGYKGPAGAYKAVEAGLRATLQEPADELRKMERERLDAIFLRLWPQVVTAAAPGQPPPPPDLKAVDRLLKVMERRAKLDGLDLADDKDRAVGDRLAELVVRMFGPKMSMADLCGGRVLGADREGEPPRMFNGRANAIPEG